MPGVCQVEAERKVFDDARASGARHMEELERHGHARPGEVDPAREPLKAALANEVLQHESEVRKLDERRSLPIRTQEVHRIEPVRPIRGQHRSAIAEARRVRRTIGIHDDEDIGWVGAQVVGSECKREAFPTTLQIVPLNHFGARRSGKRRRRIGAIIRNDQHPHARAEGLAERLQSLADDGCFIVRRHDDYRGRGDAWPPARTFLRNPTKTSTEEKGGENCERGKQDCQNRCHVSRSIFIPSEVQ